MSDKNTLRHKIVHLSNGTSVIVCTGITLSADNTISKRVSDLSWCFINPKATGKGRQSKAFKLGSNEKSLKAIQSYIEELGYSVPEAFGLVRPTSLTNLTVKKRTIYVRVNTPTGQIAFSFQYKINDPVSYHDAMDNALALRDHLIDSRKERQQLLARIDELEPVVRLLKA